MFRGNSCTERRRGTSARGGFANRLNRMAWHTTNTYLRPEYSSDSTTVITSWNFREENAPLEDYYLSGRERNFRAQVAIECNTGYGEMQVSVNRHISPARKTKLQKLASPICMHSKPRELKLARWHARNYSTWFRPCDVRTRASHGKCPGYRMRISIHFV